MNATTLRPDSKPKLPISLKTIKTSLRASEIGKVLKSALPILITLESVALIGVVDIELAGRLSAAAQAAVGLGDQLLYFTSTAAAGLSVATCAVAARYYGAGNQKRLATTIKASLSVATICGVVAMLAGWFAAENFVKLLSTDASVIRLGTSYIQLCAIGSLPYIMSIVVASIFRAIGKTSESLYLSLSTSTIAIALSYAFFLLDTPWKGTLDALCWAWICGAYLGLFIGLFVLYKNAKPFLASFDFGLSTYRQDLRLLKLLIAIGMAVVLAESSTLATDFFVYKMLADQNDATNLQAAWTIFLKVEESFAILPISALALAFAAHTGQLFGRGQEHIARQSLKLLASATSILFFFVGSLILSAPQVMAAAAHLDGQVYEHANVMVSLMPIFFPLLAVRLLMFSYLEGAGQTSTPMKLALVGNTLKLAIAGLAMYVLALGPSVGLIFAILVSRLFLAITSVFACFNGKAKPGSKKG